MSKQAFEGIMQGLEEALAYSRGDKSAAARVVNIAVKPRIEGTWNRLPRATGTKKPQT